MFHNYEIPIAYSMLSLLRNSVQRAFEPFQEYMFYWMAFNNIYTTLADQSGRPRKLRTKDGAEQFSQVSGLSMVKTDGPTEAEQLDIAFDHFAKELKHKLIVNSATKFFVYRRPRWKGEQIEFDSNSQRINGVLNLSRTTSRDFPVWSPIDTNAYESYLGNRSILQDESVASTRDQLAKEILGVLYTVRNKTFHGGKRFDDSNDQEVLPGHSFVVSDCNEFSSG